MAEGTALVGRTFLSASNRRVRAAYAQSAELIRIASVDKNASTQRFDDRQECLSHLE
jgi:hypothetical protein